MVIKPWGYSLWENIQRILDGKIKAIGCQNAYFPLFIPLSFLEKEAEHVEGFAKECAVVTHHRLEKNGEGKLVPAGALEEPLIVRPTSEMIIGHSFSQWIESYRDLPLMINQWANVVRWEMRTRMFLRTAEFLWHEGHTAHATSQEAETQAKRGLELYRDFCYDHLALPVICGEKTPSERFPGAVTTYSIEAMMQDRKALQAGTSHFLGQNFAKSSQIRFRTETGTQEYAWTTSFGATTRLIGALIMTHGDDDGLILPPRIASSHVALIPIIHKEESRAQILDYCNSLAALLRDARYADEPLRVVVDQRDLRGGEKSWSWIKKGVPIRIEIGLREIEADRLGLLRRDRPHKEAKPFARSDLPREIPQILQEIQDGLLQRALGFREANTVRIDSRDEFFRFFSSETGGGFALCHWNEDPEIEKMVKEELNVTIRCIPHHMEEEKGRCIFTQEPSQRRVLFAKSY